MARLRVYPEQVLDLAAAHGGNDEAILAGLQQLGIPSAEETWFDARATEDELLTGVYLKVRPREQLDELRPREGHVVMSVEEGEALMALGERQMRIVRAGQVVRIPPELPHRIDSAGDVPLRLERLTGDTPARGSV
jgi:mannose-6-phosphate isomerase-like protein (cupin superfamily)